MSGFQPEALAAWYEAELARRVAGEPRGSLAGPPVERYALPAEPPAAWCARMARTGLAHCCAFTVDDVERRDLYEMGAAAYLAAFLGRLGWRVVDAVKNEYVLRGDLCFVTYQAGAGIHHVGCVVSREDLSDDPGRFHTVDGNFPDAVTRNARDLFADPVAYSFLRSP